MNKNPPNRKIQIFFSKFIPNDIGIAVLSLFFSFLFLFFFIVIENRIFSSQSLLNLKGNFYVLHIMLLNFATLIFVSLFWDGYIKNKFLLTYSNNLMYISFLAVVISPIIEDTENFFSGECLALTENIFYITGFLSFFTSMCVKAVLLLFTCWSKIKIYSKRTPTQYTILLLNVTSAVIFILVFTALVISFFRFYFIGDQQIKISNLSILYKNFLYVPEKILMFFYQHLLLGFLVLFAHTFLKSPIHYLKIFNILIIVNPFFNIFTLYSYFQCSFFDLAVQIDYFTHIRSLFWVIPICFYVVLLAEVLFYNRSILFVSLIFVVFINLILRELNLTLYNAVLDPFKVDIFLTLFFVGYLVVYKSKNLGASNFTLQLYCFILGICLNFIPSYVLVVYEIQLSQMSLVSFVMTAIFNIGIFLVFISNMYFVMNLFITKK